MIAFAGYAAISLLLILIFFREKPSVPPPGKPDGPVLNVETVGLCKGLKILCSKAADYRFTLAAASLLLGTLAYGYTALIG